MKSDIEIAKACKMLPIGQIAQKLGLDIDEIETYAGYKAKINDNAFKRLKDKPGGKLILVTAINPTPAGEGKTTTTVGLGQAMAKLKKNAVICLREPSLGPVFGIKGGAAGGGYSQVVPMEDINLHFTGDMHAITAANNLICAIIDNHIHQGNQLRLDTSRIVFKRCMDMNDRALRQVVVGLGPKANGVVREDSFCITVASEIMAILCLCEDMEDLKRRISNILIGYDLDGGPVYCKQLNITGAVCALLKDAIKPNLVQTLENTPCIMHGGPFANIAHGCNSVRATKLALKLADYCITEAGFGADLGAEKFFDIKCKIAGLKPDAVVVVATIRALKYNGGVPVSELKAENIDALVRGSQNLVAHVENMKKYNLPVVVALNSFDTDTVAETDTIRRICTDLGVDFAVSNVFARGGTGGVELAELVCKAADSGKADFKPLYDYNQKVEDKIEAIVTKIYGGAAVEYSTRAKKALSDIYSYGFDKLPVCMAKTQYSLSDDPKALGRPKDFKVSIADIRVSAGAGFLVVLTGDIMTMPGLPKYPAAEKIDIDNQLNISGLF